MKNFNDISSTCENTCWINTSFAAELYGVTPRSIRQSAYKGKFKYMIDKQSSGRGKMFVELSLNELVKFYDPSPKSESGELIQYSKKILVFNDFQEEITEKNLRIGQLRARFCNNILEMIEENNLPKKEIYDFMSYEYSYSTSYKELRSITGKDSYSKRSLERMVLKYVKSGKDYMTLCPKYKTIENQERNITNDEYHWLRILLFHPNKRKIGSAIKYIKHLSSKGEIQSTSSESTLRRAADDIINKNPNEYYLSRNGEEAFRNNRMKSIQRNWNECEVGDIFIADGHRLNFTIIDPKTGKPTRMLLVVFMDARSRYVCGFSIGYQEDTQNISAAIRNAIITLGRPPKTVYIDNGRAFKANYFTTKNLENELGGLYDRLGCKVIFADPYNAKAKPIERLFLTFNDNFERMMQSYIGTSVQDRPVHHKRNEVWMKKIFNKKPLQLTESISLINTFFTDYYSKQLHKGLEGLTPSKVFKEGKPNKTIKIKELNFLMLSVNNRTVSRQGIQLFKKLYWESKLVRLVNEKVIIRYDLDDLSYLLIYTDTNKFICKAKIRKSHSPMLDSDAKIVKLNKEKAEIESFLEKVKKSSKKIIDKSNTYLELNKLNPATQKNIILSDKYYEEIKWDQPGISGKERFERFIIYFENPFTMKEAAEILNIKYGTIKKLVQKIENKLIKRNGIRDGSVLFKKIDKPINNAYDAQLKFIFLPHKIQKL